MPIRKMRQTMNRFDFFKIGMIKKGDNPQRLE